jgi:hypothetical protein
VSAIKRRFGAPTARRFSVRRPIEPKPQMLHLDRVCSWVGRCIWKRPDWESVRRRSRPCRHHECLNAEAPDEVSHTSSVGVGLDISLIPSHAERSVGNLDYKKVEVDVGRQARHLDVKVLHRPERVHCYAPAGVGKTSGGCSRSGSHHVEDDVILSDCWARQSDRQCLWSTSAQNI